MDSTEHSGSREEHWPKDVYAISMDQLDLLGVNYKTQKLYWDGKTVKTELRLGLMEKAIALGGVLVVAAQAAHPWLVSFGFIPSG